MIELAKVLIVDTKEAFATIYADFAKVNDYETTFTSNTDAALKMIVTDPPHIIVADVPGLLNGEKISDLAQKFNIPIIFASHFKNCNIESIPKKARIINKPFRGWDLKIAVRSELHKAKTQS